VSDEACESSRVSVTEFYISEVSGSIIRDVTVTTGDELSSIIKDNN